MELKIYPQAIASIEEALLQASLNAEIYKEQLDFLAQEIEMTIACNGDLKNEQMRKAKRLELQQDQDYLDISNRLKEAKVQRDRLSIQLNQLRNEFSIAKLEFRAAIASLEAVA